MAGARGRPGEAGFATPETLVGALVGLSVLLAALAMVRGVARLSIDVSGRSDDALAARWVLDRIGRDVARAGIGVDPFGEPGCPDEPLELLLAGALGVRGDRDGDDPAESRSPEALLAGRFALVPTANDEVVVWLRRTASGGGSVRARFDADLDATETSTLGDGTVVARRDGVVEPVDAGPSTGPTYAGPGIVYRVSFIHDARRYGTGRFRSVQPAMDGVRSFEVRAFGALGAGVPPCGGSDDAASRACRASVARLEIAIGTDHERIVRSYALDRRGTSRWARE